MSLGGLNRATKYKTIASTITKKQLDSFFPFFNTTVLVKQISSVTCSSSISELWLSLTESRPLDMKMWTYAQRNGRPIVARDSFVYSARSGQSQGFIKRTVNRSPREQFWRHNASSTEKNKKSQSCARLSRVVIASRESQVLCEKRLKIIPCATKNHCKVRIVSTVNIFYALRCFKQSWVSRDFLLVF